MSPQPGPPRRSRPGKPYRRPQKDPVRILAFEALRAVDERDAYANLVLPPLLRKAREDGGFDARDAALATELVYGTLRLQGTYDAIIAECVDRPLREVDPPVLDVLSLGAHQLLGTRIPTHAAVSASVELARVVLGDGRAKFVNAVLRKIAAADLDTWLERVAPPYDEDPEDHLGVVHAHPRWIVSALWDALGGGRAGIEDLLEADNERPEVTLVARPGRSAPDELVAAVGEESALPGRWSPYAVRLAEGGEPGALDAVREGRAGVQDEGSQLVALALAAAPLDGPDRRWLDGCAGPGGK
ncbi:transcription antitermination factor NusB, partial [Streptomyces botrytidirepellens]